MKQVGRHEAGMALVAGLFVTMAVLSLVTSYLLSSYGSYQSGVRESAFVEARLAAETGIQLAVSEIRDGVDPGLDGVGNLNFTATNGQTVEVTALDLGGSMYRIEARALQRGVRFGAGAIVRLEPAKSMSVRLPGAITTKAGVSLLGSVLVDGTSESELLTKYEYYAAGSGDPVLEPVDPALGAPAGGTTPSEQEEEDDDDDDGTNYPAPASAEGIPAVASSGAVEVGTAAELGGGDEAPSNPPAPGVVLDNYQWADGLDDDGDGVTDEEAYDGLDNDGDGLVDEDINEFPQSADALVGLPAGGLKARAQESGTYFTNSQDLDAYLAANGDSVPGGVIIYADFETWQSVNLGSSLNAQPSIIVHHWNGGNAKMKNVIGAFAGLLLVDELEHATGNLQLWGGVVAFAEDLGKKAFGTGNATIAYGESILRNLPSTEDEAQLIMWYRISGQ